MTNAPSQTYHHKRNAGRRSAVPPAPRSHGPSALVPGTDPRVAALLGGLRLRHPAALRHGGRRRHLPSGDAAGARAETVERRLRATLAPPEGRPLRREPEPAAALLPAPGDAEAVAARFAGPLSEVALRHRHRSKNPRYPLRRGRL